MWRHMYLLQAFFRQIIDRRKKSVVKFEIAIEQRDRERYECCQIICILNVCTSSFTVYRLRFSFENLFKRDHNNRNEEQRFIWNKYMRFIEWDFFPIFKAMEIELNKILLFICCNKFLIFLLNYISYGHKISIILWVFWQLYHFTGREKYISFSFDSFIIEFVLKSYWFLLNLRSDRFFFLINYLNAIFP